MRLLGAGSIGLNTPNLPVMRVPWRFMLPAFVGFAIFVASAIFGWAISPQDVMELTDWQVLITLCGGIPISMGGLLWSLFLVRRDLKHQIDEFMAETFLNNQEV